MDTLQLPASMGALLAGAARRFGDATALVFEGRRWTFQALDAAACRVAAQLRVHGLRAGDTLSLFAPNGPEWIVAYHAAFKLGALVNPLNLMLTPDEAAYALKDCGAVAVFGSADCIASLLPVRARTRLRLCFAWGGEAPDGALDFGALMEHADAGTPAAASAPDEACTVCYTSGTTGHPKGAVLSHRAILMSTAMTATMHLRSAADTVVSALPLSHVYGNVVMNAALRVGSTLVLHKSFDVEAVLASIQAERATMFEGVPTMYLYILNHPRRSAFDLSSLTRCTVGGQTMPEAKMREVEAAFGCPLIELWGMTELAGPATTHSVYGPARHGSIGVPLPHVQARVVATDGSGRVLPHGEVGELQVRGPLTMQGYLNRPEATAETLLEGGWLRTGDLVREDAEGCLWVVDRLKDLIITGGYNIYPAELERVVAEFPGVAMVAVGSLPDDTKGELAKAYVVPRQGVTLDLAALEAHCRQRLAAYKAPRAFQVVPDLPKTSSGKILRRLLRTLEAPTA